MKKPLLFTLLALLVTVSLVSGTTLALFSANVVHSNDVKAYEAELFCLTANRDDHDPIPGPMFYITAEQGISIPPDGSPGKLGKNPTGLWAPGDSNTRTLIVENDDSCSTLDGWLTSVEAQLESGDEMMAEKLYVKVTMTDDITPNDVVVAEGTLAEFLDGPISMQYPDGDKIPIWLPSIQFLHFNVTFDRSAGNEYQDKSLVVTFLVHGEQMVNNP